MNPGLVVKLRPTGPWRIGPDSGARNRVDFIYHSDSLFSAVTAAMAQLGSLDEWLSATARAAAPAVCFSSCFPFLDEIGFVVPPRTIWPPASPALMAARTRWKSARFVPLGIVQAILAGQTLDEHHWSVDGTSQCLVPTGRPGPFRLDTRWSAAIDRLTGASERHSTACLEFRPGSGLWTVVSFQDEAAYGRWLDPVKAAFRLLADTGFGGERSRGWGRSEMPEFIEGQLPDMILPPAPAESETPAVPPEAADREPEPMPTPAEVPPAVEAAEIAVAEAAVEAPSAMAPLVVEPEAPAATEAAVETAPPEESAAVVEPSEAVAPESDTSAPQPQLLLEAAPERFALEPPAPTEIAPPEVEQPAPTAAAANGNIHLHWLLSLFSPAPADAVDWNRGNYSVLTRGGRVESPSGSGELKKQVQMVSEGSVLYAGSVPAGAAPDVAPDGFAHPVFRAGFAVTIPLPEVRN